MYLDLSLRLFRYMGFILLGSYKVVADANQKDNTNVNSAIFTYLCTLHIDVDI